MGLILDLTKPDNQIHGLLETLLARCQRNLVAETVLAQATVEDENRASPDPSMIIRLGIRDVAVDDTTAYAIMAAYKRGDWKLNKHEFDSAGMLRSLRPPRGNGVAIEAFGVRWIPESCERTLLTGEVLAQAFPYITHTERTQTFHTITIGRVTIPALWVEGTDYHLVASPRKVNCAPDMPGTTDYSNNARFTRNIIASGGWPYMDMDPNRKVIIPRNSLSGFNRIMRLQDVPGFRIQCANPTQLGPNEENQAYERADPRLDAGLWDYLVSLRWHSSPFMPRLALRSTPTQPEAASATTDVSATVAELQAPPATVPDFDVEEAQHMLAIQPIVPPPVSPRRLNTDTRSISPISSAARDADIYAIVASKMGTQIVDRSGTW